MEKHFHKKEVACFKRWTRKSYSVFSSLKVQTKIASLSVALIMLSFEGEVIAQQTKEVKPNNKEYNLDTLEVIGELTPELATDVTRNITIVDRKQLESSPIRSLQDAINSISTIDLRTRGKNDVQSDISLRGSNFDQVQILLNGFDISDPQTGHYSLNLPIAISQVNNIEVLTGPASRALGPNAYAGAVNFTTPKPKSNSLEVDLIGGDFGLVNLTSSLSIKNKNVGHYISANYASSSGYAKNTDFRKYSMFYYGEYERRQKELSWQTAYSNNEFGASNFYTPKYPNQFDKLNNIFAALSFKTKGKIATQTQAHYRANFDEFQLFRDGYETPSWYKGHNYHFTQVLQASTKVSTWSKYGKTTIAINMRHEKILSNVLGNPITDTIKAKFSSDGFYTNSYQRTYGTISLEQLYDWNKFKIAAGLMYYYFPSEKTNKIFPGFDLTYSATNDIKLFASINTGMRLPTFTDLFYSGPANIGNPNLIAESQIAYEIGAKLTKSKYNINIKTFFSNATNSIDWVRKNDTIKWQPINITSLQTFGFDMDFNYLPSKTNCKAINWINSFSIQWSYLTKSTNTISYESHYVMDYLRNKVVIGINHNLYKNLTIDYSLRYNERVGQYLYYDFENKTESKMDYKPYFILDTRLTYTIKTWSLYLDISNVFNTSYQDYGNVLQPGRWASLGVKKKFDI